MGSHGRPLACLGQFIAACLFAFTIVQVSGEGSAPEPTCSESAVHSEALQTMQDQLDAAKRELLVALNQVAELKSATDNLKLEREAHAETTNTLHESQRRLEDTEKSLQDARDSGTAELDAKVTELKSAATELQSEREAHAETTKQLHASQQRLVNTEKALQDVQTSGNAERAAKVAELKSVSDQLKSERDAHTETTKKLQESHKHVLYVEKALQDAKNSGTTECADKVAELKSATSELQSEREAHAETTKKLHESHKRLWDTEKTLQEVQTSGAAQRAAKAEEMKKKTAELQAERSANVMTTQKLQETRKSLENVQKMLKEVQSSGSAEALTCEQDLLTERASHASTQAHLQQALQRADEPILTKMIAELYKLLCQVQEAMKPHAVKLYHAVESVNTTHLYVKAQTAAQPVYLWCSQTVEDALPHVTHAWVLVCDVCTEYVIIARKLAIKAGGHIDAFLQSDDVMAVKAALNRWIDELVAFTVVLLGTHPSTKPYANQSTAQIIVLGGLGLPTALVVAALVMRILSRACSRRSKATPKSASRIKKEKQAAKAKALSNNKVARGEGIDAGVSASNSKPGPKRGSSSVVKSKGTTVVSSSGERVRMP